MLTCFSALKRANTVPDEFTQYTGQIHTVLEGFTQYRTGSYGTRWIHTVPDGFTRYQTDSYGTGRVHTVPDGLTRYRTNFRPFEQLEQTFLFTQTRTDEPGFILLIYVFYHLPMRRALLNKIQNGVEEEKAN